MNYNLTVPPRGLFIHDLSQRFRLEDGSTLTTQDKERVRLSCSLANPTKPQSNLHWQTNGKEGVLHEQVTAREEGLYMSHVQLDLVIRRSDHEKEIVCSASQEGYPLLTRTGLIIDVQDNPTNVEIYRHTKGALTEHAINISIPCRADGYPPPSVYWAKDDATTSPGGGIETFESTPGKGSSTLFFRKLNRDHSGIYSCYADNGIPPSAKALTEIIVNPLMSVRLDTLGVPHDYYNGALPINDLIPARYPST
ncbi:protein amalgam-like [Strongylocentrotus purpuratus]|uniref:Ig-like domain-containing protein n=1 Tax=Strongylocentrotus purpuratus TaxID=7668 RepID=A0A7M7PCF8_STRPU|nr:protein amalgam-like [Strongylocentrotus purpuratus]